MKKITKKEREEFKLKMTKDTLENKKRVYDEYVEALVEYNMSNMARGVIYFEELWRNQMKKCYDMLDECAELGGKKATFQHCVDSQRDKHKSGISLKLITTA